MRKLIQRLLAEFDQFSVDKRKQCATMLHGLAMIVLVQYALNKDGSVTSTILALIVAAALWIAAVKIVP